MSVTLCMLLTHGLTVLRTRYADARLRPRSAPGPPRSSAPLRGREVSRRVREDELDATAFVASARVRIHWLGL